MGLFLFSTSCDEQAWLEEKPLDFLSPENSYNTETDFNNAVARLHTGAYSIFVNIDIERVKLLFYPSDIMYDGQSPSSGMNQLKNKMFPTYAGSATNPDNNNDGLDRIWKIIYRLVFDANAIIDRVDNPDVEFSTPENRNAIKGEALFFRAFAYRHLASLWGGVPLILEEVTTPRRDFVRNTREEVWIQCIEDLEFASKNCKEITSVEDGRISNAAAYHLLSEMYINAGNETGDKSYYVKAVEAASAVINNPRFGLMKERFGKRKDDPGDVYWDLFRRDNQNHNAAGNTEAIWVRQYEHGVVGGGTSSRWAVQGQTWYSNLRGKDGQTLFLANGNAQYPQGGTTANYGGRGVGLIVFTDYMNKEVWDYDQKDDPNSNFNKDMRNSEHNIYRDIKANNPESAYNGQYIVAGQAFEDNEQNNPMKRHWTQIYTKVTPVGSEFPAEQYASGSPSDDGFILRSTQNSYTDWYIFRLAETYLLRAEAHLQNGDPAKAAEDINQVRGRAKANPVAAADVTLDYILDERARELVYEELRVITLMRMSKYVERVKEHNPYTKDYIDPHHNLWPIPQSEIENNIGAVLEQNPGYPN